MAEIRDATIRKLTPDPDGARTTFYTPTPYQAGSLRVILNGQVYEPDDSKWGWSEVGATELQLLTAPRADDVLQAFYRDRDGVAPSEIENVVGSPFHPNGLLP